MVLRTQNIIASMLTMEWSAIGIAYAFVVNVKKSLASQHDALYCAEANFAADFG